MCQMVTQFRKLRTILLRVLVRCCLVFHSYFGTDSISDVKFFCCNRQSMLLLGSINCMHDKSGLDVCQFSIMNLYVMTCNTSKCKTWPPPNFRSQIRLSDAKRKFSFSSFWPSGYVVLVLYSIFILLSPDSVRR